MKTSSDISQLYTLYHLLRESNIKMAPPTMKPNYMKFPRTTLEATEENKTWMNKVIVAAQNSPINKIVRTTSGGISTDVWEKKTFRPPCYDIIVNGANIEITLVLEIGCCRILFTNYEVDKTTGRQKMSGREAWKQFEKVVKECFCQPLESVANTEEEGEAAKAAFPKAHIEIFGKPQIGKEVVYENVHHMDIHSAHCAGMAHAHPEYKTAFLRLYDNRHTNPIYKDVLTHIWGFAQSKHTRGYAFRWAQWSKEALEWTNCQIESMCLELLENGRKPLLLNTDGIWYQGDRYSPANEGGDMGQWAHDHTDCRLRIKSAGSYEFMEGDTYKAVVRGRTRLDKVKPREEWEWGDIFQEGANKVWGYWWDETFEIIRSSYVSLEETEKEMSLDNMIAFLMGEEDNYEE